ncbi:glycosyltransferase family 4 protein [soil metagenome]
MKKIKVLLVSLLKPIDDPRMYGKLGRTLRRLPHTEIHLCGFAAPLPADQEGMFFHPLFFFRRLSAGRFLAQTRYLRFLHRLRPDLIIVCTHELLLPSLLYKGLTGARVVYDVQENYGLNLRSQEVYPAGIRVLLAFTVRQAERLSSSFVDHYLLAEKSYVRELPFVRKKYSVLENKVYVLVPPSVKRNIRLQLRQKPLRLLYSGSISRLYGVFEAVELGRRLRELHPGVEITIIGYCSQPQELAELRHILADKPYITLIGGDQLVPHADILACIEAADMGLLPYRPHPSTFSCIPTKLFEYLAYTLPFLIQPNPTWEPLVHRHQAGLFIDFAEPDPAALLRQLEHTSFYPAGAPAEAFWETEAPKLLAAIKEVLQGQREN